MKYLFIDIRKSDEAYRKHFLPSEQYKFYNIPMNMIRFNKETIIEHLEYVDEIYIVCQGANRSQFVKDKYFANIGNIKVDPDLQFGNLKPGVNNIVLKDKPINVNVNVGGKDEFNLYNVMRILQLVMGTVILAAGGYTYLQLKNKKIKINKIPLIILLIMGVNAIYNGLTSTCSLSTALKDKLN